MNRNVHYEFLFDSLVVLCWATLGKPVLTYDHPPLYCLFHVYVSQHNTDG
jgi:hypothetical protein